MPIEQPRKNWLITDTGVPINLDYVTKVKYGADFTVPKPLMVVLYHPVSAGQGATEALVYATADEALASYEAIIDAIVGLNIVTDLRPRIPVIESLDVITGPAAGGTNVTLTGSGFIEGCTITFDAVTAIVVSVSDDGTTILVIAPAHAAGLVDIVYDDTEADAVTSTGAFTYV